MIAAISPPPTSLSDALIIIAICIPVALLLHAFTGASMVRKARATDPASAEMVKARLRSVPSVPLAGVFVFFAFLNGLVGVLTAQTRTGPISDVK